MRRSPLALFIAIVFVVAAAGTAIATSSTDSQANQPQVAGDATSNATARFPTNKQNEPSVAIAPDGTHAIAGSNDEQKQPACGPGAQRGAGAPANDCSFFPNVGTSGVYTSSDAGATWTNRGLLPGYSDTGTSVAASAGALPTSAPAGSKVSDGDPVVAFGPKLVNGAFTYAQGARAYYANLTAFSSAGRPGNQFAEMIGVSISDDYGASWYDPVIAAQSNGNVFNDKESLWADRNPASPYFGRVYVSYTEFRSIPSTAEPVIVVYSADGGLTWSKQNQVSAAYNNRARGGRQGSVVRTGPNGEVYVIFEDGDNKLGSQQIVVVSLDGGKSFSRKISIAAVTDIAAAIPGANFRTDSFASAAVDQSSGAIYATWSDAASGSGRIVVSKGTNQGRTWSAPVTVSTAAEGYAFFQGLDVAPNGRIDIGYQAQVAVNPATYGTGNAAIDSWYVSSSDGGATWSAPRKISSASSDPAASAQNNLALQFWGDYSTLASTDDAALFIYTDSRTGAGCPAVDAYQHGLDGSGPAVAKPAPGTDCPAQFGNSDVYVSKVTP
ncbi:MAG TPA: sialidase family protein [Candidatus Limnocylindria bacterium]|nr:sialidase family protein [Candidatus Limnocylindria bacterium]